MVLYFYTNLFPRIIFNVNFYFYDISSVFFASYFSSGFKVWSFGAAATAALAGLMGEMIYSPYDITGIFHWIKQVKIIYFSIK